MVTGFRHGHILTISCLTIKKVLSDPKIRYKCDKRNITMVKVLGNVRRTNPAVDFRSQLPPTTAMVSVHDSQLPLSFSNDFRQHFPPF